MNRSYCALLALVLLWAANSSHAAVFERDWKTPGDGLLTYDDVNRCEWLDLSVSALSQFPEPRLQNVIAELSPGGMFQDFQWAVANDAFDLAQSAGIDVTTTLYSINQSSTMNLVNLLGVTYQNDITTASIGFLDEVDPISRQVGADFLVNFNPETGQGGVTGLIVSSSDDLLRHPATGLMLFRVVPEPPLPHICLCILAVLTSIRARRQAVYPFDGLGLLL